MYVSWWDWVTWQFWREDGMAFDQLPLTFEQQYGFRDRWIDRNFDPTKVESKQDMMIERAELNPEYADNVEVDLEEFL